MVEGLTGWVQSIRVGHTGNSINQNIDGRVCGVPTTDNDSFDYRRENLPSIDTCRKERIGEVWFIR